VAKKTVGLDENRRELKIIELADLDYQQRFLAQIMWAVRDFMRSGVVDRNEKPFQAWSVEEIIVYVRAMSPSRVALSTAALTGTFGTALGTGLVASSFVPGSVLPGLAPQCVTGTVN
jgi:hypothetical protein